MSRRPHVTTRCVADAYADRTCERIVEFGTSGMKDGGGLIAIRNHQDGTTSISVYRCDHNVRVYAGGQVVAPEGAAPLNEARARLIDAAPDMLAALEGLLAIPVVQAVLRSARDRGDPSNSRWVAVADAIDKAKGVAT